MKRVMISLAAVALAAATARGQEPAPAPKSPDAIELLALNPLASLDKSTLEGFRDAPLFTPSRTRPAPPPPPVAEAPPPPPPEPVEEAPPEPPTLKLSGIVQGPDGAVAFVAKDGEDAVEQLRLGDQIDGWLVSTIDPQSLKLSLDDREQEYRLFVRPEGSDAGPGAEDANSDQSSDDSSSSDDETEDEQSKVQREHEAAKKAQRAAGRRHQVTPPTAPHQD